MSSLVDDIKELMSKYQSISKEDVKELHKQVVDVICDNIKDNAVVTFSYTGTNGNSKIDTTGTMKFTSYINTNSVPDSFATWLKNLNTTFKTLEIGSQNGYVPSNCKPLVDDIQLSMNKETAFESAWNSIYEQISKYLSTITGYSCACSKSPYIGTLTVIKIKY